MRESHPAPQKPADLTGHNCLRYAHYPFGDDWTFEGPDGREVSARVSGSVVTNSGEMLRRLMLDGHGLILAPSFLIVDDVDGGKLVRLMPDYRPVEFSINAIYPHRHHLSTKVRSFLDLLALRFAEHHKWMS